MLRAVLNALLCAVLSAVLSAVLQISPPVKMGLALGLLFLAIMALAQSVRLSIHVGECNAVSHPQYRGCKGVQCCSTRVPAAAKPPFGCQQAQQANPHPAEPCGTSQERVWKVWAASRSNSLVLQLFTALLARHGAVASCSSSICRSPPSAPHTAYMHACISLQATWFEWLPMTLRATELRKGWQSR